MEKGKMTKKEKSIHFQKSKIIGILTGIQINLGNFNLESFTRKKGAEGLEKLERVLTTVANVVSQLDDPDKL